MLPRLGEQVDIEIEVISKPRHEYLAAAYTELGLPRAPAVMIGDEVIIAGRDIEEATLINEVLRRLSCAE